MKYSISSAIIALLAIPVLNAQDVPKDQKDKASYGIGFSMGSRMKRDGVELNPQMISKGIIDGFSGANPLLTEAEIQQSLQAFQTDMQAKMAQKQKDSAEKNKKEGEAFLAANKSKDGVKTLPSGLQYKIISEGKGEKPKSTDTVSVNYRGTLIDGTEFDSSYKRNEPVSFPLDKVIPGWTEGLQQFPVGTKAQLFIPASLAYGENAPPTIGPNATLIFDIELLAIKNPDQKPEAARTPVSVTTEPVSAPSEAPAKKKKNQ